MVSADTSSALVFLASEIRKLKRSPGTGVGVNLERASIMSCEWNEVDGGESAYYPSDRRYWEAPMQTPSLGLSHHSFIPFSFYYSVFHTALFLSLTPHALHKDMIYLSSSLSPLRP